jgi:hypothetical protein
MGHSFQEHGKRIAALREPGNSSGWSRGRLNELSFDHLDQIVDSIASCVGPVRTVIDG